MAAHYHIYHHEYLAGLPAFTPGLIPVPEIGNRKLKRWRPVQSLRTDMARLREMGIAKGIVDPGGRRSAGKTALGKDLLLLAVGKGEQHKVLIAGCHHAREWISVEIPFLLAKYLIENYTPEPSAADEGDVTVAQKKRIKHLVENRQIWFVPMVNPDGHYYSMTRDRDWRSNRQEHELPAGTIVAAQYGGAGPDGNPTRTFEYPKGKYKGVDINRNYPTRDWGFETYEGSTRRTSRDPRSGKRQVWVGPDRNSEKETQAMVGLIEENHFKASISYHSYGKFLVYSDLGRDAPYLQNVGDGMWRLLKDNPDADKAFPYNYVDGDAGIPPLYPITGHFSDFCAEKSPGQPTFTNELPPHDDHPSCERWAFSGLPDKEIEPIFRENLTSALALINSAGFSEPAAAQKIRVNAATHTVQVVDNCWRVFADYTE